MGIRPEQITLYVENHSEIRGKIYSIQPSGSETLIQVKTGELLLLVKQIGLRRYHEGQEVSVSLFPDLLTVYEKQSGNLIKLAHEVEE